MSNQQVGILSINKRPNIYIILLKSNIFIVTLITTNGIFYKIISQKIIKLLNLQKFTVFKNFKYNKSLINIHLSSLIQKEYTLFYYKRYYLKLKGLGFSFKYVDIPKHVLLFNIGFSKLRFIKIPKIVYIIKKPRKKKNILVLISTNFYILLEFITLIKKLKIPDPYKIKGLRYIQEGIKVKTGKKKK